MLDSVWRLAENNFDVDHFLNKFDLMENAVIFHQGGKGFRGKIRDKSGFNITVSENPNSDENIFEMSKFITKHENAFAYLAKLNIQSVFDIGCTVGSIDQYTKSINMPCEFLGMLNQLNISLEFSAYPASDEQNET